MGRSLGWGILPSCAPQFQSQEFVSRENRLLKNISFCDSERSEESLFGLDTGKERFLGAQRASE
jgi:hypothetical protein